MFKTRQKVKFIKVCPVFPHVGISIASRATGIIVGKSELNAKLITVKVHNSPFIVEVAPEYLRAYSKEDK